LQRDDGFVWCQEQRLAGTARDVPNRRIELAAIFLESQWHGRKASLHIDCGGAVAVDYAVAGTFGARLLELLRERQLRMAGLRGRARPDARKHPTQSDDDA
jgi:hypothetical protein